MKSQLSNETVAHILNSLSFSSVSIELESESKEELQNFLSCKNFYLGTGSRIRIVPEGSISSVVGGRKLYYTKSNSRSDERGAFIQVESCLYKISVISNECGTAFAKIEVSYQNLQNSITIRGIEEWETDDWNSLIHSKQRKEEHRDEASNVVEIFTTSKNTFYYSNTNKQVTICVSDGFNNIASLTLPTTISEAIFGILSEAMFEFLS